MLLKNSSQNCAASKLCHGALSQQRSSNSGGFPDFSADPGTRRSFQTAAVLTAVTRPLPPQCIQLGRSKGSKNAILLQPTVPNGSSKMNHKLHSKELIPDNRTPPLQLFSCPQTEAESFLKLMLFGYIPVEKLLMESQLCSFAVFSETVHIYFIGQIQLDAGDEARAKCNFLSCVTSAAMMCYHFYPVLAPKAQKSKLQFCLELIVWWWWFLCVYFVCSFFCLT